MATGQAIVCEIKKHIPIPDRDIIVSAHIFGENIIINKETTPVGTRGILIDCESVLDHDFCSNLNLFRHETLNKDITKKGYIEDSGRVRAIKFNKVPSSALFISFEQLETIPKLKGISSLQDGTQLNDYNGINICKKYVRKFKVGGKGPASLKKNICPSFHEHQDTEQLMRNLGIFNENNILTTTTKIHGTSCRCGYLPVENESWFRKILNKLFNISNYDYRFVVGSRHVVKYVDGVKLTKKHASYYETDIWTKSAKENFYGKLHKGETVYYEIAGYEKDDSPIMPSQSNEKLKKYLDKDSYKEFIKKYGDTTHFTYGCKPGEYKIFVYRITHTNSDGISIDLTWPQVKARCQELGVDHVRELEVNIYRPYKRGYREYNVRDEQEVLGHHFEKLSELPDTQFPNQIHEGIVVRVDRGNLNPKFLKLKTYNFRILEGIIKDNKDYVDIEENN